MNNDKNNNKKVLKNILDLVLKFNKTKNDNVPILNKTKNDDVINSSIKLIENFNIGSYKDEYFDSKDISLKMLNVNLSLSNKDIFNVIQKFELSPNELSSDEKNNRKIFVLFCIDFIKKIEVMDVDDLKDEFEDNNFKFIKLNYLNTLKLFKRIINLMILELNDNNISYIIYGILSLIIITLIVLLFMKK